MEQILVNGLFSGAQYSLIALGLTLIFGLMNVLNFAHGQMYVFGGLVTYTIVTYGLGFIPPEAFTIFGISLIFPFALICSGLVLAVLGAVFEKFLFRTVIRRSKRDESTMLLAAATAFLLDAALLLIFGEKLHSIPDLVSGSISSDLEPVFPSFPLSDSFNLPYYKLVLGVIAFVMILLFIGGMRYTKPGRAMRALAQDRVAAQLMGVNVSRYTMIGFAVGAMLAGMTGGLLLAASGGIQATEGGAKSVLAFEMIMLGGAGVTGGAIAGGFILGMLQSVGHSSLGEFTDLVIFAALVVFLSIRPQGIMGKPWG
ncbi:MAG: branched-chain amino acid ABC transporter permease [Alphaproteobacteria bacterium]|nr:branched-chain amino acid ABC transporter permease [Alphaproteobacteria bacterium]